MTRDSRWSALLFGVLAAGGAGRAEPPSPIEDRLRAELRQEADFAKRPIQVRTEPGPLGLRIVTALAEGAYPGTGVYRTIVDDKGTSFGVRGDRDFADLVRARGWLKQPPAAAAFCDLVNIAQFDRMMMIDERSKPSLRTDASGLELQFVRRRFPSGAPEQVAVRIGSEGSIRVERHDLAAKAPSASPQETPPGDRWAQLRRTLDRGSRIERDKVIRALAGRRDARALALLAYATTLADGDAAAGALWNMGTDARAVSALRKVWSRLPTERRASLVRLAAEARGESFADKLR